VAAEKKTVSIPNGTLFRRDLARPISGCRRRLPSDFFQTGFRTPSGDL